MNSVNWITQNPIRSGAGGQNRCHDFGRNAVPWALTVLAAVFCAFSARADAPGLLAFDFELVDTSLEGEIYGEDPAQTARLASISQQVRDGIAASGKYCVIHDGEARAAEAALREQTRYLHRCNECELKVAQGLGADFVLLGWVQKVSNLILNLNAVVKNAQTGEVVRGTSVDIRSNTDRSWERGARQVVTRLLTPRE